jgi:hypothetical protein
MKHTRRSVPLLAGGGVLLLIAVAFTGTSARGADPDVVTVEGGSDTFEVTWGGDTMLGDGAQSSIDEHGYDWPFERIAPLVGGDVVVVNAEAPITTVDDVRNPDKDYSYAADPGAATAMADAGVDVLGLANNHTMDQGEQGMLDTIEHAGAAGMATFGAGKDDAEAERPLLIQSGDTTIGVVALAKFFATSVTAGMGRSGMVPFSTASIARGHRLAKAAGADVVVGYAHWGTNYADEPDPEQLLLAQEFADAGYDLVVGHGPHVMQGVEMIGEMPVVHSLGNFVFGAPGRFEGFGADGHGLLADTRFGPDGLEELRLTCITVDNRKVDYQPTGCDEQEAGQALEDLGVSVTIDGITATVDLDAATDG